MRHRRWRGAWLATAGVCLLPAPSAGAQVVTQEQVADKTPAVNEGPQPHPLHPPVTDQAHPSLHPRIGHEFSGPRST